MAPPSKKPTAKTKARPAKRLRTAAKKAAAAGVESDDDAYNEVSLAKWGKPLLKARAATEDFVFANLANSQEQFQDDLPALDDEEIEEISRPRSCPDLTEWTDQDTEESRQLWEDSPVKKKLDSLPVKEDSFLKCYKLSARYLGCSPMQLVGQEYGLANETKCEDGSTDPHPILSEHTNRRLVQLVVYPWFYQQPGTLAVVIAFAALVRRNESRACVFVDDSENMFISTLVELFKRNNECKSPGELREAAAKKASKSPIEPLLRQLERMAVAARDDDSAPAITGASGPVDFQLEDLDAVVLAINMTNGPGGQIGLSSVTSNEALVQKVDAGYRLPSKSDAKRLRNKYFFELFDLERARSAGVTIKSRQAVALSEEEQSPATSSRSPSVDMAGNGQDTSTDAIEDDAIEDEDMPIIGDDYDGADAGNAQDTSSDTMEAEDIPMIGDEHDEVEAAGLSDMSDGVGMDEEAIDEDAMESPLENVSQDVQHLDEEPFDDEAMEASLNKLAEAADKFAADVAKWYQYHGATGTGA